MKTVDDTKTGGETVNFATTPARYVRIQGISRAMEAYGYSIYEIEVYGTGKHTTGISNVGNNDNNADTPIFDLGGRKIGNANGNSTKQLPKGIYIVGKHKVANLK